MKSRLPLRYIIVFLSFHLLNVQARQTTCTFSFQTRDGDDDDDDDNNSGNSGNTNHRFGCTNNNGISKGAIAGIVIGCLVLVALLILLGWWCMRRRRTRSQQRLDVLAASTPQMREGVQANQHNVSSAPIVPGSAHTPPGLNNAARQQQPQVLSNVQPGRPSVEFLTLPNPYERDVPPPPPPHDDVPSPTSPLSRRVSASAYTNTSPSSHSHSYSAAPSAWPFEDSSEPLLSRGPTQASRLTASSSLHDDLVGYQKALEAHHRKVEEEAVQGEGSSGRGRGLPEDPPPVYRDRE
ncbi:hypothetical protein FKP32DRAFT_1588949 [Trametes sanguinea]|nr:hypothetical protein FKP32DRAFT_1588949 [Trametes sanguinea]